MLTVGQVMMNSMPTLTTYTLAKIVSHFGDSYLYAVDECIKPPNAWFYSNLNTKPDLWCVHVHWAGTMVIYCILSKLYLLINQSAAANGSIDAHILSTVIHWFVSHDAASVSYRPLPLPCAIEMFNIQCFKTRENRDYYDYGNKR